MLKYLNELRTDVLENTHHKLTPDSFMTFLDRLAHLTPSESLNDMWIKKIGGVNIDEMKTKKLLAAYQSNNIDYKFEENIRIGEIKQFAEDVVPKSRFIFDNYKIEQTQKPGFCPPTAASDPSLHEGANMK